MKSFARLNELILYLQNDYKKAPYLILQIQKYFNILQFQIQILIYSKFLMRRKNTGKQKKDDDSNDDQIEERSDDSSDQQASNKKGARNKSKSKSKGRKKKDDSSDQDSDAEEDDSKSGGSDDDSNESSDNDTKAKKPGAKAAGSGDASGPKGGMTKTMQQFNQGFELETVTRNKQGVKTNNFRDLCLILQLQGLRLPQLMKQIEAKGSLQEGSNQISMENLVDAFTSVLKKDSEGNSIVDKTFKEKLNMAAKELTSSNQIPKTRFTQRLDMEMTKLVQMERFFIGLQKRMKKKNFTKVRDVIAQRCPIDKNGLGDEVIDAERFFRMLERFGIILSYKFDDTRYFYHEYGHASKVDITDLLDSDFSRSMEDLSLQEAEATMRQRKGSTKRAGKSTKNKTMTKDQGTQNIEKQKFLKQIIVRDLKMKHATIKLAEIEKDFKLFTENIIPQIEVTVMKMVAQYVKNQTSQTAFYDLVFGNESPAKIQNSFADMEDSLAAKKQKSDNKPKHVSDRFKSQIHIYTLYSMEELIANEFLKKKDQTKTKDFKPLFNLFALQASNDDKTTIPFNHIYRVAKDPLVKKVKNLQDKDLDEFIVRDNKNKMMIWLGEQHAQNKVSNIDKLFKTNKTSEAFKTTILSMFSSMFTELDINEKDIDLLMQQFFSRNKSDDFQVRVKDFQIEISNFINELRAVIKSLQFRNITISQFNNHLNSKHIKIDQVFEQILGIKNTKYAELSLDQVSLMFQTVKFEISIEKQRQLVAALSPSGEGNTILVDDLIRIAEDDLSSLKGGGGGKKGSMGKLRRFQRVDLTYHHMAQVIMEKRNLLTNFGPLLKGHDFYQKVHPILDQMIRKFKKIGAVVQSVIDELNRKLELEMVDQEKKRIQLTIQDFQDIQDEIQKSIRYAQDQKTYQGKVKAIRDLEHFENVLPSAWQMVSGSAEPSLEISNHDLNMVMNFLQTKEQFENEVDREEIYKFSKFEHQISVNDLYQVIMSVSDFQRDDGILKGDVMSLIGELEDDCDNKDYVDLDLFRRKIEEQMTDKTYNLKLESKVQAVCEEEIIDTQDQIKNMGTVIAKKKVIKKPECFESCMIDIACGLQLASEQSFVKFFEGHTKRSDKKMPLADFETAINRYLNCNMDRNDSYDLYNFLVAEQNKQKMKDMRAKSEQGKSMDYSDEDMSEETVKLLSIKYFFDEFKKELPFWEERGKVRDKVLEHMAIRISDGQFPVVEIIDLFRVEGNEQMPEDFDMNNVKRSEFIEKIMEDCFQFKDEVTTIKMEFVAEMFEDPKYDNYIQIDQFIESLITVADKTDDKIQKDKSLSDKHKKRVKIFKFQADVENFNKYQKQVTADMAPLKKGEGVKMKKKDDKEKVYFARSEKNTHMTLQDRLKRGKRVTKYDHQLCTKIEDVMMRTRATGLCVESYFQKYGSKKHFGITFDQFQNAIKKLQVDWADDMDLVKEIWDIFDTDDDKSTEATISFEEIAASIFDYVKSDVFEFETEWLELIFNELKKTNKLTQLRPVMIAYNRDKDNSCSVKEFRTMMREQLGISEKLLENWKLDVIIKRYAIKQKVKENETRLEANRFQFEDQKIFYFQMMIDIGLKNLNTPFKYSRSMRIAQTLENTVDLNYPDADNFIRFVDDEGYVKDGIITLSDFEKVCKTIQVIPKPYKNSDIQDFLDDIGHRIQGRANTTYGSKKSQDDDYEDPEYLFTSVKSFFDKYINKKPQTVFQDTLNLIFIESKRKGLSQSMMTIFTEYDELDGAKDGYLNKDQFVEAFQKQIGFDLLNHIDFEYLCKKYRDETADTFEEKQRIYYEQFYDDYKKMSDEGIDGQVDGLKERQIKTGKAESKSLIEHKIDDKYIRFYQEIDKWMRNKKMDKQFCEALVEEDRKSGAMGYLKNKQFQKCFNDVGMGLTYKQVGQATYSLHRNEYMEKKYSWTELIVLIFGVQRWQKVRDKHHLVNDFYKPKVVGQDVINAEASTVKLSENFLLQVEFNYTRLIENQKLAYNKTMLNKKEFVSLFDEANLGASNEDLTYLNQYFDNYKDPYKQTMTLKEFMNEFEMSDRMTTLQTDIQQFLSPKDKQQLANKKLNALKYKFEDLVFFLKNVGYDLTNDNCDSRLKNNKYRMEMVNRQREGIPEPAVERAEFEKVYKNLFDIHRVHSDENKMITKKQVMNLFSIAKIDVSVIEMGESLAKKKAPEKKVTPRGSSVNKSQELVKKPQVYTDNQKQRQIEDLRDWLKPKTKEQQIIKKITDERMTKQNFVEKLLVKKLEYCKKPCRETEILSQAFQKKDPKEKATDDKSGKPPKDDKKGKAKQDVKKDEDLPIWIDIVQFKKAMNIKEEKFEAPSVRSSSRSKPPTPQSQSKDASAKDKGKPQERSDGRKKEPEQEKKSVKKTVKDQIAETVPQIDPMKMNKQTQDILNDVNAFLKANGFSDMVKLFEEMDKDKNKSVDKREFVGFFETIKSNNKGAKKKESQLDKRITEKNLGSLFDALDADKSRELDIKEFCAYLGYTEKLDKKKTTNIDSDTQNDIDNMVDRLFRKVDSNHNGFVDLSELYQLLKPLRPGKISEAECQQVLNAFDSNNDGQLDQEEFYQVVKSELQRNLTCLAPDIDGYKKLFYAEDKDKDMHLNQEQLNKVLFEKLKVKNITQKDVKYLINFLSVAGDGLIGIEELFTFVANVGSINFAPSENALDPEQNMKNATAQKCLLAIRESMSIQLFEYFNLFGNNALPKFFEPSFLQDILEKQCKHQPSMNLVNFEAKEGDPSRKTDEPEMKWDDPSSIKDIRVNEGEIFLINMKDIDNVPVPKVDEKGGPDSPQFRLEDVIAREVRVILFNETDNNYLSNTYIVPAASADGMKWKFDFSEALKQANQFIIKNNWRQIDKKAKNEEDKKSIQVMFELVLTIKPENIESPYQVTNGWGTIYMSDLVKGGDSRQKVQLKGGSPANLMDIDKDSVKAIAKKKQGMLGLGGNKDKKDEEGFFITLEVKPVQNTTDISKFQDIVYYAALPMNFIFSQSLLGFVTGAALYVKWAESEEQLNQDIVVAQLQKCFDITDVCLMLGQCWNNKRNIPENTSFNPVDSDVYKNADPVEKCSLLVKGMKEMVVHIWLSLLTNNKAFKYDSQFPTRPSLLTDAGMKKQESVISAAVLGVRQDVDPNEAKGTGSEFLMEGAEPFSMDEFLSEKQGASEHIAISFDDFLAQHSNKVGKMA